MKKKLIAGNWKMNGSLAANEALVRALVAGMGQPACDVAVAVPAPYLAQVAGIAAGSALALAAQDVSVHEMGAYTGETSAAMLRDFGARYVLVGHSERRQYHGETDAAVAAKAQAALSKGITPIVCVGETLAEREANQTEAVVGRQLQAVIDALGGIDLVIYLAGDYVPMRADNFDLAVAEALKFADTNGETLVIVTADHETGGLVVVDGDEHTGRVTGVYVSDDHTPAMLPVFAYGPGADKFCGTYMNTEIARRIKSLIK